MRLTVGPLPAPVYWRRRAAVATALALVIILFAVMCGGPDASTPTGRATSSPVGPQLSNVPTSGSSANGSPTSDGSPRPDASPTPDGSPMAGSPSGDAGAKGQPGGGSDGGGQVAPAVVATVPCTDAEISLTAEVSPSPGVYGGVITLTLVVRNTATHACLRDVGSAPQELQVRQGTTVVWSSDHCNTPQASDVRAFGPNIESRFPLRWNTYRVAPHECDPPSNADPAATGSYQVLARLDTKLSAPVPFQIQK